MNLIEAGKICRDAGFNWGRGSWWILKGATHDGSVCTDCLPIILYESEYFLCPDLSKGATRGVILEWAREMSGISTLHTWTYFSAIIGRALWDITSLETDFLEFDTDTEIECYAKLCQWVKENMK